MMSTALIENKPEFVKLLLHNGLVLGRYFSCEQLLHLYEKVSELFLLLLLLLERQT